MRGVATILTFAACLAAPNLAAAQALQADISAAPTAAVEDPWQGFNRDLFSVHKAVDEAVLEPVARGYRAITPGPVRQGVLNFLRNLRGPVIFTNDVLQGEFGRAGTTAARFGVNTTVGIAGVFDPATSMGLERHDEDFGQTLAVWGVASGPYLFVPLMGPTTLRDGAGRIIDVAFDPLTWAEFDNIDEVRAGRTIVAGISARENLIETIDALEQGSLDPYVAYRSSYFLARESAIANGRTDVQDLPDFEGIDDMPAIEAPAPDVQTPAVTQQKRAGANRQHKGEIDSSAPSMIFSQVLAVPMSSSVASGDVN